MILHIVSPSPFSNDALQRCLNVMADHDALLLIEDATLALSNLLQFFPDTASTPIMFVLTPDQLARGLVIPADSNITAVDYDGFVTLTTQYAKTISWF